MRFQTYTGVLAKIETIKARADRKRQRVAEQEQREKDSLTRLAAKLKVAERDGVIDKIRDAVGIYGLTEAELFGPRAKKKPAAVPIDIQVEKAADPTKRLGYRPPKYRHPETGVTWTGGGSQPRWATDWLAANPGKTIVDLLIPGVPLGPQKKKSRAKTASAKKRPPIKRDQPQQRAAA